MTLLAAAIVPPQLETILRCVRTLVPEARESFDSRGFRVLHWLSTVSAQKPKELSLEHEARLKLADQGSISRLLVALQENEDRELAYKVLPGDKVFGGLLLRRVHRSPGPQSLDRYYDIPDSQSPTFLGLGYTFRQRLRGGDFMTWGTADEFMYALNLEFPSVDLQLYGVRARLEFNWIDDVNRTFKEAFEGPPEVRQRNPVFLAQNISGIDLTRLGPVVEIETVRYKYFVVSKESKQGTLVINVDVVTAKDLSQRSTISYADVDLSCMERIGETEIVRLAEFARRMAEHYGLVFNPDTKASRSLIELGKWGHE